MAHKLLKGLRPLALTLNGIRAILWLRTEPWTLCFARRDVLPELLSGIEKLARESTGHTNLGGGSSYLPTSCSQAQNTYSSTKT